MNISKYTDRIRYIREEAATWVIRLEDECVSDNEVESFRDWMSQSDRHRRIFKELNELSHEYSNLGVLSREANIELPESLVRGRSTKASCGTVSRNRWRFAPSVAAVAMVIMGLFFLLPNEQVYITHIGQRLKVSLPDGSTMHLNSNSQLTVNYKKQQRLIELVYGEANFEVEKNPSRPFIVRSGSGSATALGTEFDVRKRNANVTVTVFSGAVLVESDTSMPSEPTNLPRNKETWELLKPGHQITYSTKLGEVRKVPHKELARTTSWREGKLFFDDNSLKEILHEISNYTTESIVIADSSLQSLRLGGVFKVDDIDSILTMLEAALPVSAVRISAEVIVLHKDEEDTDETTKQIPATSF